MPTTTSRERNRQMWDMAAQMNQAVERAAKPRLRWRHRTSLGGVPLGDWEVRPAPEPEAIPLLAASDDGYRMAEADIVEFFRQ